MLYMDFIPFKGVPQSQWQLWHLAHSEMTGNKGSSCTYLPPLLSWKYPRSMATLGFIVKKTAICGEMFPLEILKLHIKENNNEHYLNINWKIYFSSVKLIRLKSPWETCNTVLNLNTSQQFTASFCQLFPKPHSHEFTQPRMLLSSSWAKPVKKRFNMLMRNSAGKSSSSSWKKSSFLFRWKIPWQCISTFYTSDQHWQINFLLTFAHLWPEMLISFWILWPLISIKVRKISGRGTGRMMQKHLERWTKLGAELLNWVGL